MIQVLPNKFNTGNFVGEQYRQAYQNAAEENRQYNLNRSRLQEAMNEVKGVSKEMQEKGEYDPITLFTSLAKAGAGIPGWSQVMSEGYPIIGQQLQNQIMIKQQEKDAQKSTLKEAVDEATGTPPPATEFGKAPKRSELNVQFGPKQAAQPTYAPTPKAVEVPSRGAVAPPQGGVPSLVPPSIKAEAAARARFLQQNGVPFDKALEQAAKEAAITTQDIQNYINAQKAGQEIATSEKALETSFRNFATEQLNKRFGQAEGGTELDPFESEVFNKMSEKYKGETDVRRYSNTLDEYIPWLNEKRSISKIVGPNTLQRLTEGPEPFLKSISDAVQPFAKRGDREKDYTIAELVDKVGLSKPEANKVTIPVNKRLEKYLNDKMSDYPRFEASPFGVTKKIQKARQDELNKEFEMVENLSLQLPKLITEDDSLISIWYDLMGKGWNQRAYTNAVEQAVKNGMELTPRQKSEQVQLGKPFTPGFWTMITQPLKYWGY